MNFVFIFLLMVSFPLVLERDFAPVSSLAMSDAASEFLSALNPDQCKQALFEFDDDERFDWAYTPRSRKGISIKELQPQQRAAAINFMKSGLSEKGAIKATTIMELELVLREIEGWQGRDPELYFVTIFGTPSPTSTWGWRVEGHHLSLNFTIVNGVMIATTPSFLGANPAEVRHGPRKGLRTLKFEEDIARELVQSLSPSQLNIAQFSGRAPRDIITTNREKVEPLKQVGIPISMMTPEQSRLFTELINEYAGSFPPDLAELRIRKVQEAAAENIYFGWAGGTRRGEPHYYRIQGPTFLIEYDNTQNGANHIHTVWRDFHGDFGRDLLREHYRNSHHH